MVQLVRTVGRVACCLKRGKIACLRDNAVTCMAGAPARCRCAKRGRAPVSVLGPPVKGESDDTISPAPPSSSASEPKQKCDGREEMRFAVQDPTHISPGPVFQSASLADGDLKMQAGRQKAGMTGQQRRDDCWWWAANASRMASSPPTRRKSLLMTAFSQVALEAGRGGGAVKFQPLFLPAEVQVNPQG